MGFCPALASWGRWRMLLVLSLLGPMEVTWADRPVAFATTAARALVAYLALEGERPHPREQLAALLWPEQPQATAYNNLRQTVSRVRKALPDPAELTVLEITSQTIRFRRDAGTIDVTRFEALVAECAIHAHA